MFYVVILLIPCRAQQIQRGYLYNRTVFSDDFYNDNNCWIAEIERPDSSSYKIANGNLDINTSSGATLWFKNKLTGNIIITYEATVVDSGGANDRVSDLNVFWMAIDPDSPNLFTRDGKFTSYNNLNLYYVGYGGNNNTTTRFRKYYDRTKPVIKEYLDKDHLLGGNKKYYIKIICDDGTTSYAVDNELLFELKDRTPLVSGYFGIRAFKTHLRINNFKVETINGK